MMGHRANFFVRRNGKTSIRTDHDAALWLDVRLLLGSEIWLGDEDKGGVGLYDDVWCEGSAFVDFDAKRLLWTGGDETNANSPHQRGIMDVVQLAWPGWKVEWAAGDVAYVAKTAGHDFDRIASDLCRPDSTLSSADVLEEIAQQAQHPHYLADDGTVYLHTLLSVLGEASDVQHYALACEACEAALAGPDLVRLMESLPLHHVREFPKEDLESFSLEGIVVDLRRRWLWLWADETAATPEWIVRIEQEWPGWRVQNYTGGIPRHAALAGLAPSSVRLPWEPFLHWFERRAAGYLEQYFKGEKLSEWVQTLLDEGQQNTAAVLSETAPDPERQYEKYRAWRRRRIAFLMVRVRQEGLPSYPDSPYQVDGSAAS